MNQSQVLHLIKVLDNWNLYKSEEGLFVVIEPNGCIKTFTEKSEAKKFMLLEFYKKVDFKNSSKTLTSLPANR
ncbi:hypothetical protein [Kordia jejudonensis]|uniref:hypothetical protein n=1 Tax=Kordia jejudonensis TaxID=1348245 RepID=UPI000629AAC6|nr:hypothetical protein [Kordia jejudonensis]